MRILDILYRRREQGKKSLAVLVDPDKVEEPGQLRHLIDLATENCVDFFFVGGSLITTPGLSEVVRILKENSGLPVILFPGASVHIDPTADAILFLSLISGRNPELLIGQHVVAAPVLKNNRLEVMPTGYMLINSGRISSVAYMSNTTPIPEDKYSLAACTAMAGEMLGLKLIYLDAGSGAEREVSARMINAVRKAVEVPLIVGGGIDTPQKAQNALQAGADMLVIGNALEKNPDLLIGISEKVYDWNQAMRN
jgi:putative glycerol-1-phosphate prenyltransferase